MAKNMGLADRKARAFVVAPLLLVVGLLVGPAGWLAIVLYVLATVMLATAAVGSCPLYTAFGLRSWPLERVSTPAAKGTASR